MSVFKLVSWNVAALTPTIEAAKAEAKLLGRGGGLDAFFSGTLRADIVCVQEAKVRKEALSPKVSLPGYESFWSIATKAKCVGKNGVTTFVRDGCGLSPVAAVRDVFGDPDLDDEGRCMMTDHGAFVLFNVYVPNAGDGDRPALPDKLRFLAALQRVVRATWNGGRRHVIVAGDFNISMAPVDVGYPGMLRAPWHGYSEAELEWMQAMLTSTPADGDSSSGAACAAGTLSATDGTAGGAVNGTNGDASGSSSSSSASSSSSLLAGGRQLRLVDSFRARYPTASGCYTVWDMRTDGRGCNVGCRIDFVAPDEAFFKRYCTAASSAGAAAASASGSSDDSEPAALATLPASDAAVAPPQPAGPPVAASTGGFSGADSAAPSSASDSTSAVAVATVRPVGWSTSAPADSIAGGVVPVLTPAAAGAIVEGGHAAIIMTPRSWSDHAAVLLTMNIPADMLPPPHDPVPLSSRRNTALTPGGSLRSMWGAWAASKALGASAGAAAPAATAASAAAADSGAPRAEASSAAAGGAATVAGSSTSTSVASKPAAPPKPGGLSRFFGGLAAAALPGAAADTDAAVGGGKRPRAPMAGSGSGSAAAPAAKRAKKGGVFG